jgi:hypothetical protein
MKRILAITAAALLCHAPAGADFAVSKPKASAPAKPPKPAPKTKPVPKAKTTKVIVKPKADPRLAGIDPEMVREAIVAAGYKADFFNNSTDGTQRIDASSSEGSWAVSPKECTELNRCRLVEYGLSWPVSNAANICNSWKYYIIQDQTGTTGLPTCYAMPSGKEFRLTLTSDQGPYVGLNKASKAEARQQLISMTKLWASYVSRLGEARDIATKKCPKKKNKCW